MTLLFQKWLKLQENKNNEQELNLLKKILWNLTIDSTNQNQTNDFKLNINRNNLRRLLHQSTLSKMQKQCSNLLLWFKNLPIAKYLLAHKILYIFLRKKFWSVIIQNLLKFIIIKFNAIIKGKVKLKIIL